MCIIVHIQTGNEREISEEMFHRIDGEIFDSGEEGEEDLWEGIWGTVEERMVAVKIGGGKSAVTPVLAEELP